MGPTISSLQLGNGWFEERHGGLDRVFMELIRHLPDAGVLTRGLVVGSGLVTERSGGLVTPFASPAAPLPVRVWSARRAVRSAVLSRRPDVFVAHFALYAFAVLDQLRALPFVVHFQGPWAAESDAEGSGFVSVRLRAEIERAVYRRADRLIVLSQSFGDELVRRYGVDARRVRVVPGGVDATRFATAPSRDEARAQLGWPNDRAIVLCVRRLVHRMGLADLIDAASVIRREVPDVLVIIAGSGPLRAELQDRIDKNGLQEHVRLLGRISDETLPAAYSAADVTVVPTVTLEGFGLITLESLAAGTPVLVTPVGGLPEAVAGLERGLVLDGVGVVPLARGLSDTLRGARSMPGPEACREYVRTHFDWPIVARQVRDVYVEAVAGRS